MSGLLGAGEVNPDQALNKMKETLKIIQEVNAQFKNPVRHFYVSTIFGRDFKFPIDHLN